jgi:hypothetical protein
LKCITAYKPAPDTAANRIRKLPSALAFAILNRRFSELAKKEAAPFVQAAASVSESFKFVRDASVELTCKPDRWQAALALGEQELRRALEHGFQPDELKEVVVSYVSGLEQAVKSASTRRSGTVAGVLLASLVAEEVFTSPADRLALLKPALEKVTLDECAAALREAFSGNGLYVMVTGNAKISGDAVAAIDADQRQRSLPGRAVEPAHHQLTAKRPQCLGEGRGRIGRGHEFRGQLAVDRLDRGVAELQGKRVVDILAGDQPQTQRNLAEAMGGAALLGQDAGHLSRGEPTP